MYEHSIALDSTLPVLVCVGSKSSCFRPLLESNNFQAVEFNSESAAFDFCIQHRVDGVVVDESLSGTLCTHFVSMLRDQDYGKRIYVIMVSDKEDTDFCVEALQAGVDYIAMRPVIVAEIEASFQSAMRKRYTLCQEHENRGSIAVEDTGQPQIANIIENLAAKEEMLSAIAHHWRQPLNIVSLLAESMCMEYEHDKLTHQDFWNYVTTISEELRTLSESIDHFRRSLPAYGEDAVEFSLLGALSSTLYYLWPQAKNANISVTMRNVPHGVQMLGQAREFEQGVLVILQNRCAAVSCNLDDREIRVCATHNQGQVEIIFESASCEYHDQVLQHFFAKDEVVTLGDGAHKKITGENLTSLYYAKIILVERMKGRLRLERKQGITCITLVLPCVSKVDIDNWNSASGFELQGGLL
ncbi:hybrid sensor histidine kinase/response regulator [Desulfurispira natronophila]|uniref:histidine kinase n=1 Tax=Desulfurispira natronophila TaxID=682562 RepID=A0A7W7Y2K8_9BACT|nr:hybrid sensor histidine kinase/response regulator [Desulfurispira natronophila]MBB5020769.1 DNA-binding response OmpR family regulator [Desulfurispira natronophila]